MIVHISLWGCLSLGNESPVTSIFTGDRGLGEVQHLPDAVHNVSITTKTNIQSPLREKLLIIYFQIGRSIREKSVYFHPKRCNTTITFKDA